MGLGGGSALGFFSAAVFMARRLSIQLLADRIKKGFLVCASRRTKAIALCSELGWFQKQTDSARPDLSQWKNSVLKSGNQCKMF